MLIPARLRSFWRNLIRRRHLDQELDEEVRSYLYELVEKNIKEGMVPDEARRAAQISLGGIEQVKERVRDARAGAWLTSLSRELRIGLRQLRRDRGFALTTVLTLALGLAAVITIFTVVDTVVLRPLDFPHSERIFTVSENLAPFFSGPSVVTIGQFQQWQKSGLFEHAAAIDTAEYTFLGRGRTERLFGASVTPDFFRVFEVRPFLGRGFVAQDATPGHDNVIVRSYALWRSDFAGDPHIIGKAIRMSEGIMTVIGVMPPRFDFPRLADVRTIMYFAPGRTDFWTPMTITQKAVEDSNFNDLMVGRLKDGVTPQRAAAEFKTAAVQLFREVIAKHPAYRNVIEEVLATFAVYVVPLRDTMSQNIRGILWMLLAAVGLLLALVLFNLGSLLLTRGARRVREFVVREALGATRWQLFRQSALEQILLIAGAALISLALSEWGVSVIRSVAANRLPRLYDLSIDLRIMALLFMLSLLVAIIFGALPLLVLRDSALTSVLQSESRSATSDRRANRLKSGLMVLEIAVSMILLLGAGLLIRSFANVMRVNPGFDPHNLLTLDVSLNPKTNQNAKQWLAHMREMLAAFRRIPGVESAAIINEIPLIGATEI
jgi:predicted permease